MAKRGKRRDPNVAPELLPDFWHISKREWIDAYADLYRSIFHDAPDEQVLADARERLRSLSRHNG